MKNADELAPGAKAVNKAANAAGVATETVGNIARNLDEAGDVIGDSGKAASGAF